MILLEYYAWRTLREIVCQVACLASHQDKYKKETADQYVNLKKQWRHLEMGQRRWSGTAQQIRCLWTGRAVSERDRQTWSTLWDCQRLRPVECLWRKQILSHYLCVSMFVLFEMCDCLYYRVNESFLQSFERQAPGPLASSSATHTSSRVRQQPHNVCALVCAFTCFVCIHHTVCACRHSMCTHMVPGFSVKSHICGCGVGVWSSVVIHTDRSAFVRCFLNKYSWVQSFHHPGPCEY